MRISSFFLLGTVAVNNDGRGKTDSRPKRRKVVIQRLSKSMGDLPSSHPHFFNILTQLGQYPDAEIKLRLQYIRTCFETITVNCDVMSSLKKAITVCSNFLVILFSPGTLPDVAAPSSMAIADHLHNVNYQGTLIIKTFFLIFITIL